MSHNKKCLAISVTTTVTFLMVGGLLLAIGINFWFLYIVFLCFQWINAYNEKSREPSENNAQKDLVTKNCEPKIENSTNRLVLKDLNKNPKIII